MKKSSLIAFCILSGMFFLMLFSSLDDSATFDEVAHIGAGYTYLTEKDGRLNPEHPPLIKDLAALPLLFLDLNFSTSQPFWIMKNVNDRQWLAGNSLLYESGNNADKILFWSRLPIMFLAIIFGWILFWWTRKNYGTFPAFFTLLFFALSPVFLAHSRYVTTDLGATLVFFLSIILFTRFLEKDDKKSLVLFGVIFGLSLLVKFSLVILLPFFVTIGVVYNFYNSFSKKEESTLFSPSHLTARVSGNGVGLLSFLAKFMTACLIAIAVIWLFYIPHILNYSLSQNLADAKYTLGGYKTAKFAPEITFTLLSNKLTQPLGQYLHGFLMVAQRTTGGNSAYFLGEVSSKGWVSYFPVLFLTKEHIGLYVLIVLAIILALKNKKKLEYPKTRIFLAFIIYYWAWSVWSPLNIGVRHILPTFPFIYILISKTVLEWVDRNSLKKVFVAFLFVWMALEIAFVFPYFLSFYNKFGGGWKNGYKIATDSNYDWGQDLKRLKIWVQKNSPPAGEDKIYLDYFGGGSPKYYFGDKAEFWRYEKGSPPKESYFAVSANSLVGAENLYFWLKDKEPIDRAGSSIFIFRF